MIEVILFVFVGVIEYFFGFWVGISKELVVEG